MPATLTTDPSGAMGAIQRTLANDVACRNVALDFSRQADRRLLFPDIEPDVLPGASSESDDRIRRIDDHHSPGKNHQTK